MHRAQRTIRAAFVVAFAASVVACAEVPVVQNVPEREANRVVATLDQAGIASQKAAEESSGSGGPSFRVSVGADEVARAVAILNAGGLPRHEEPGFAETYGQASLVQTASEERARAAQSVAGELARTLERIDGVLDARVHIAFPDARDVPLDNAAVVHPSASVLVRYAGARAPYEDDSLRRLVAGAVNGMRAEDVAIVGLSRPLPPSTTEARLAWVGPIAVSRGSLSTLRVVLGASMAVNLLLAGGLIWLSLRRRKEDEPPASNA
jgi:type III secretion protein J